MLLIVTQGFMDLQMEQLKVEKAKAEAKKAKVDLAFDYDDNEDINEKRNMKYDVERWIQSTMKAKDAAATKTNPFVMHNNKTKDGGANGLENVNNMLSMHNVKGDSSLGIIKRLQKGLLNLLLLSGDKRNSTTKKPSSSSTLIQFGFDLLKSKSNSSENAMPILLLSSLLKLNKDMIGAKEEKVKSASTAAASKASFWHSKGALARKKKFEESKSSGLLHKARRQSWPSGSEYFSKRQNTQQVSNNANTTPSPSDSPTDFWQSLGSKATSWYKNGAAGGQQTSSSPPSQSDSAQQKMASGNGNSMMINGQGKDNASPPPPSSSWTKSDNAQQQQRATRAFSYPLQHGGVSLSDESAITSDPLLQYSNIPNLSFSLNPLQSSSTARPISNAKKPIASNPLSKSSPEFHMTSSKTAPLSDGGSSKYLLLLLPEDQERLSKLTPAGRLLFASSSSSPSAFPITTLNPGAINTLLPTSTSYNTKSKVVYANVIDPIYYKSSLLFPHEEKKEENEKAEKVIFLQQGKGLMEEQPLKTQNILLYRKKRDISGHQAKGQSKRSRDDISDLNGHVHGATDNKEGDQEANSDFAEAFFKRQDNKETLYQYQSGGGSTDYDYNRGDGEENENEKQTRRVKVKFEQSSELPPGSKETISAGGGKSPGHHEGGGLTVKVKEEDHKKQPRKTLNFFFTW